MDGLGKVRYSKVEQIAKLGIAGYFDCCGLVWPR